MRKGYLTELSNCTAAVEESLMKLETELCQGVDEEEKLNPLIADADTKLKDMAAALKVMKPALVT